MKQKNDWLIKVLYVISWIIFIGVSIDAGGVLSNTVYAIFINPNLASHFWNYIDLSKLYEFNQALFVTLTTIMSIVTIAKAILFYSILKIFHDQKVNFSKPFTIYLKNYLYFIAYCAFVIGAFSNWGSDIISRASLQHVILPEVHQLKIGGADVWLLMGFVILVFAIIFKKGIELQSENDLTV